MPNEDDVLDVQQQRADPVVIVLVRLVYSAALVEHEHQVHRQSKVHDQFDHWTPKQG